MPPAIRFFLSESILLPFILAVIRFKKADTIYYPFLFNIFIGTAAELVSYITIEMVNSNVIPSNIFVLLDCILFLYQFKNWEIFSEHKKLFYFCLVFFVLFWIIETVILRPGLFNSYFRITYYFALVLMSITVINKVLVEYKVVLKDARFLICAGIIISYVYRIIVEVFWLFNSYYNADFLNHLLDIISYVNTVTNILFAYAIIKIPMKRIFINEYTI